MFSFNIAVIIATFASISVNSVFFNFLFDDSVLCKVFFEIPTLITSAFNVSNNDHLLYQICNINTSLW